MPRIGLSLLLCAGTMLGALSFLPAAPEDDSGRKTESLLAVQRALVKGREHLKAGNYKAAIEILERELLSPNIFENRDYLRVLSDAYLGYIVELKRANRLEEAAVYQRRLAAVDPGALLELRAPTVTTTGAPVAATPKAMPMPTPVTPGPSLIALTMGQSATTVRGQVKDEPKGDPFDDDNSHGALAARELLDRAEREFEAAGKEKSEEGRAKHYAAAGRLYEQAEHAFKGTTADARERWGYCKLHAVVNALNHAGGTASPKDLEREVSFALELAPKLDTIGRDLLKRIQERQGAAHATEEAAVEVKHTPRQGDRWGMAETMHFRVMHLQSREVGEKVARVAEAARLASARKWLGEPLAAWPTRCDIYVYNTAEDYARARNQSPQCPGHSTMPMEGDRVLSRRIDVHCDDPNYAIGVLPHEVTHVVLAGRFPGPLPRWADEGMAVLSEPRDRVERHLRNLPNHAQQEQLFNIGQLMQLDNYPEPARVGAFYAQSVSLVDYLTNLRGPVVFSQFLAEGMRGNSYEAALQKHYKLKSYEDLHASWQRHAFGDEAARASSQP